MADRKIPKKSTERILALLITLTLASCNFPGLSPSSPTPEVAPSPTRSSTETPIVDLNPTTSPTSEAVPDPISTPTQALPPILYDQCRPFPDQIYPPLEEGWLMDQIWVKCGGTSDPLSVRSPVEGLYWDYSNQTGKLVYGTHYSPGPDDLDVWVGDYGLWVYDYRTDLSTQWIKGGVLEARWAPEVESDGIQELAVLLGDGTVALVTGPEKIEALVNIDRYDKEMDACCIAWSTKGDKLAYVKNETVYVVPTTPREPRMLAENAFGPPIWVLDQQLLLFPSSTIKIARADGSGPFIPQTPDGNRVWVYPESELFWNPETRTLVFDELHLTGIEEATTWVYGFSEDFETIIEQYACVRTDSSYVISWYDQGNTMITSSGQVIPIRPGADRIALQGIIQRAYQSRFMLWLEEEPYPLISVSLRAQVFDAIGNSINLQEIKPGMKIELSGQALPDGCGFLAHEIQILEE